ncbi:PD-(D/E)XK nuclease family protein [Ramlibacter sp. MMS24-I3-19]|uniref:PD-(D/E)XK nuclease family protein n=1 Tax=Ramlibacter sp. MMS24-I3-19 TaxID=3416606 RepID=UPI003D066557
MVVLLPYAQLMPLARREWARLYPQGFAPRFETSMNWASRLGHVSAPDDVSFDRGRDLLTARAWLERAGLGGRAALLAGTLVDATWQAAGCAAALPPSAREAWARDARASIVAGLAVPQLALEAAVARIALEWAAASHHATDALLQASALEPIDLLVLCEGLQADALGDALASLAGEKAVRIALEQEAPRGALALHQADDPSHEAEIAAACVLRHLEAGRAPVALGAIDRMLTRRVRALLGVRGIAVRDETGWKLSTTRAAAQVMAALRACQRMAGSDDVLDWLKNLPGAPAGAVLALERRMRRDALREWADVQRTRDEAVAGLVQQVDGWRDPMQSARTLLDWQSSLGQLLRESLAWQRLDGDAAGAQVLDVLGLSDAAHADWAGIPQSARRLTLSEFMAWVDEALEAATFAPPAPGAEQVVVLPMHQLLARDFAALVLPGCDEVRLPAAPEPPGTWTPAQRQALGLPLREALTRERAAAWQQALQVPHVDIVWRRADDSGEPVLPSPLVQALRLEDGPSLAADPREPRELVMQPVVRPEAHAPSLTVSQLSASAYEDLRRCPYRFFALRQLGLQEASEIDVDLDKRDFGTWLHAVLGRFHEALSQQPDADRAALLDQCADDVTAQQRLSGGEFLPFHATWPQVRDGYLAWLAGHEGEGARFSSSESAHEMPLGSVRLVGRIDRIDDLRDGRRMVIDYKTESLTATTERVKLAHEDTQLAFYAALLDDDTLRAAYVNVGERGATKTVEQPDVVGARDALVEGITSDLERIAQGAALPALGEGRACEFCAARGLCRKDSWHG